MASPVTSEAEGRFPRVIADISAGRHREAYTLFCVGVVLTLLGLWGLVAVQVMLSAVLAALTFLVFQTTVASGAGRPSLNQALQNRDGFAAFGKILPGVRDLRIYGPTAVSALTNAADIRRYVLRAGGQVRILTLADDPQALAGAAFQLDDNLDLGQTLRNSLATAAKLSAEPGFSYRQLPVNPGFSLVIVNADEPGGYLIFECHGFRDDSIADRMHIKISKADSPRWFTYWVTRFEAMWEAAKGGTSSSGQGAGESELGERAGVEAGHGADLAAGEGEDEQPCRMGDAGLGVFDVNAERGLAVGPGRYESGPAAGTEPGGGEEPGD